MAILVDLNQTMISNLMVNLRGGTEVDPDLVRHMVFNSLRSYKQKFGNKYGQLIICCDDKNYWRKQLFPYYKASRKDDREKSDYDWNAIFTTLNMVRDEIKEHTPYKVIQVPHAEADDVIGSIIREVKGGALVTDSEQYLVLSGDKDFQQLQRYPQVDQYSPILSKFLKCDNPIGYLREHIIKGDRGDGVPNALSSDDVFVNGERQKAVSKKKLEEWIKVEGVPEGIEKRNYYRNKTLVDLEEIPPEIYDQVIDQFKNVEPKGSKRKLMDFFIQNRMRLLLECIEEF
jgi:5'-3' exonuclease